MACSGSLPEAHTILRPDPRNRKHPACTGGGRYAFGYHETAGSEGRETERPAKAALNKLINRLESGQRDRTERREDIKSLLGLRAHCGSPAVSSKERCEVSRMNVIKNSWNINGIDRRGISWDSDEFQLEQIPPRLLTYTVI